MASNFNPLSLLSSPISGAFQLAGAKDQADAAKEAAQLQAQAAQEALDFTKQKQAEQQAAFMPYQNLGAQAVANLPGAVRQMPTQGPPPPYGYGPQTPYAPQPTSLSGMAQPLLRASPGPMVTPQTTAPSQAPAPAAQLVTVRLPSGQTTQVPASQLPMAIAQGAQQV